LLAGKVAMVLGTREESRARVHPIGQGSISECGAKRSAAPAAPSGGGGPQPLSVTGLGLQFQVQQT